jgi:hypothetical protein
MFFLTEANHATEGWGRFRQYLLKRIEKEIELNPQELGNMCATFVRLFDAADSDCQPSAPWQKLADKARAALAKRSSPDTNDPWVNMILNEYRPKMKRPLSFKLFPFKEDKCATSIPSIVAKNTDANTGPKNATSTPVP